MFLATEISLWFLQYKTFSPLSNVQFSEIGEISCFPQVSNFYVQIPDTVFSFLNLSVILDIKSRKIISLYFSSLIYCIRSSVPLL